MPALLLKVLVVYVLVIGALLPLLAWAERRRTAFMGGTPLASEPPELDGLRPLALLQPLLELFRLVARSDTVPTGANRPLHLAAPAFVLLPSLLTLGVLPFAGVYDFGGSQLSLVVANPDWGILYVLMLGGIASYGVVMAGWASNDSASLLGSLRSAAQMVSYGVGAGLSIVGLLMVYGTLQLQDMVIAQDRSIRVFGLLEATGVSVPPFLLEAPFLMPAWGIFLQPLAFVLFFACLLAHCRRAPFDALVVESDLAPGYARPDPRQRFGLFYLADLMQVVVIAALLTTLFLGGWSLPWFGTDAVIAGLTPLTGAAAATWLCVVFHVAAFLSKMLLLIGFQLAIRWTLPRLDYEQVMDFCWKGVVPLSLLNIFLTGLALLLLGGGT